LKWLKWFNSQVFAYPIFEKFSIGKNPHIEPFQQLQPQPSALPPTPRPFHALSSTAYHPKPPVNTYFHFEKYK
jgi:hypothetical protein